MKVSLALACECGFRTKVTFRKPDFWTPSVGAFSCSGCHSRIRYLILKTRGGGPNNVEVRLHLIEISAVLKRLRDDEAQAKGEALNDAPKEEIREVTPEEGPTP